jgi:hypothetical protein
MGALATQIAAVWEGQPDPEALRAALGDAALYCPVVEGRLWSGEQDGIRWLFAFTSAEALARFAVARGAGHERWRYVQLEGARLWELALPAVGGPAGLAVDIGSGRPMLFPALETVEKAGGR